MKRELLLFLLLAFAATRLPMLEKPFLVDENLYARMIDEQTWEPSMQMHFFGETVGWKPPLFFWAYTPVVSALKQAPIPVEYAYRIPTLVIGFAAAICLYGFFRESGETEGVAFAATLIYVIFPTTIESDAKVMMDTMLVFFLWLGMYAYERGFKNQNWFVLGAACGFLAFLTKTFYAALLPLLAVLLFLKREQFRPRKANLFFLLSLLSVPAAYIVYNFVLSSPELVQLETVFNITRVLNEKGVSIVTRTGGGLVTFISESMLLLGFFAFGFAKNWRKTFFYSAWTFGLVVPVVYGYFMAWYFLPFIPPIAYFVARVITNQKQELDGAGLLMLIVLTVFSVVNIIVWVNGSTAWLEEQKEVGAYVHAKENVLLFAPYSPTIMYYMTQGVRDVSSIGVQIATQNTTDELLLHDAVYDYVNSTNESLNTEWKRGFFDSRPFRKTSNTTNFEYVIVTGNYSTIMGAYADYSLEYNTSQYYIFRKT